MGVEYSQIKWNLGFEGKMIMFCLQYDLGMMYLTLEEDLSASFEFTDFARNVDCAREVWDWFGLV